MNFNMSIAKRNALCLALRFALKTFTCFVIEISLKQSKFIPYSPAVTLVQNIQTILEMEGFGVINEPLISISSLADSALGQNTMRIHAV